MARFSQIAAILLCCFLLIPQSAPAAIYYVDVAAYGANNGTSWTDAFTDIQAGVDTANVAGGGEVWVKSGIYTGPVSAPKSDSFEELDHNAVDIIGEEKNMDYTSSGAVQWCHLTILYLTGDVATVPTRADFGNTTQTDSFAVRLTALAQEWSDVLVFANHPTFSPSGGSISGEDLAAAANANALHAMEIVRYQ